MEWWQTTLLAGGISILVASVPTTLLFILQRKGANAKLKLDQGGLNVTQFDVQTKAYQDLLNRANDAAKNALAELEKYRGEREELMATVKRQGEQIDNLTHARTRQDNELTSANGKIETLRQLMLAYIKRTGIPLTPEEQAIFDDTIPADIVRKISLNQNDMSSLD